jgi:hypothetical protein
LRRNTILNISPKYYKKNKKKEKNGRKQIKKFESEMNVDKIYCFPITFTGPISPVNKKKF